MALVDSLSPTTEEWGEGKGEGIPISRANSMEVPLSPALSPLVPRRERERRASAMVVVSRCAAGPFLRALKVEPARENS